MNSFLRDLGIRKNQHIILHSSYKEIRSAFPKITPIEVIQNIQQLIGNNGSLIMPSFTYCFKSIHNDHEVFDRVSSAAKVGFIAEVFRISPNVVRTSSPTHSFSLWGKITNEIFFSNSPYSPLGEGSVLDWLANSENTFTLLCGTNFESLSFCHYLEVKARLPWSDFFPWAYLGKQKIGISISGEQPLIEIPGCSKSFTNFESYLIDKNIIEQKVYKGLKSYFIPINILMKQGVTFFKDNPEKVLCPSGSCKACASRHKRCFH
jgi:aminoglycoside N3'-acetyltransferase